MQRQRGEKGKYSEQKGAEIDSRLIDLTGVLNHTRKGDLWPIPLSGLLLLR